MEAGKPVYLKTLRIGDHFRTSKYEDNQWSYENGYLIPKSLSNCMYQRCHCVFAVTSVPMATIAPRSSHYRAIRVVKRCDSKARRHEDTHRTARYKIRGLPKNTVGAFVFVWKLDPLAEALADL